MPRRKRSTPPPLPLTPALSPEPGSTALPAGIDEAGRGCLAGPVVAAAVILPAHHDLPGLDDSKKLTAAQRERLAAGIRAQALAWGLGMAWQEDIDRVNILQATFMAMARAVGSLRPRPATPTTPLPLAPRCILVDGNKTIPTAHLALYAPVWAGLGQRAEINGDARIPCIAAASILAKTCRDRLMEHLHRRYPCYGFARHKGYGTSAHRAALRLHGPCPLHRLTFGGVREYAAPSPGDPAAPALQHLPGGA